MNLCCCSTVLHILSSIMGDVQFKTYWSFCGPLCMIVPVIIFSKMWADHLLLVNNFTMLVSKICSGYKEAWKLQKRRILRGKVPSLLSLPVSVGFLNFFGWTDQQRMQAAKEGLGYRLLFTGRLVGALVLLDAIFFLALNRLVVYFRNCNLANGSLQIEFFVAFR